MTACECDSDDFIVVESIVWKAFTDDDGGLQCNRISENGVDSITCYKCEKEYQVDDFTEVNFS